jgi:hypothetical protein
MSNDASPARPSYITPGYELRRQIEGPMAEGLGRDDDQQALFYTRGWADEDWVYPITVFVASYPNRTLIGTAGKLGNAVELGVQNVTAVYHDGMWVPGPGEEEHETGAVVLHWERSDAHSLTISSSDKTYAVRGPKRRGVTFDELLRIAGSFWSETT